VSISSPAFSADTGGGDSYVNDHTVLNLGNDNFFKPDARLYRHDWVYISSFVRKTNAVTCNVVRQEKHQESHPNHALHLRNNIHI
jgi:hypothetical protein